jgi:hypothetical protein
MKMRFMMGGEIRWDSERPDCALDNRISHNLKWLTGFCEEDYRFKCGVTFFLSSETKAGSMNP